MSKELSITRRLFANVIDAIVGLVSAVVIFFLLTAIFGPAVTDSGYYIGSINIPYSKLMNNPYTNVSAATVGEIWTIIIYVLGFSLSQLLSELKFSSSLGIKIMGGIVKNEYDNPITKSEACKRFFARVMYLPTVFCLFTHIMDIRPTFAILFIYFITFIFLLKDQKNVIEKLTSTGTFSKKN